MLASRGIASLSLAFFAYDDLPKNLNKLDLEYFEEAVEVLLAHPEVISDRCGVIAVSKATDVASLMAVHFPKVKALVSISGSPVVYDSTIYYKNKVLVEGIKMKIENLYIDEKGRLSPNFNSVAESVPYIDNVLPYYEAPDDTYFYFVAGDEDAWFCNLGLELVLESFRKNGFEDDKRISTEIYSGAGHIIEPPYNSLVHDSYMRYLPVENDEGKHVRSVPIKWGGTLKGTCKAQEDFWPKMISFINHHVRDTSSHYQNFLEKS